MWSFADNDSTGDQASLKPASRTRTTAVVRMHWLECGPGSLPVLQQYLVAE